MVLLFVVHESVGQLSPIEWVTSVIVRAKERRKDKAIETLIAALKHSDPGFRQSAVWMLGEIGDENAIAPLEEALKNDPDSGVRRLAAEEVFLSIV